MLSGRVLAAAVLAGVLGAVLVAVLILGRSDRIDTFTLEDLDRGGVFVSRTEVYQRHGAKAEQLARLAESDGIGLYPERRVDETWALLAAGGQIIEAVTVAWTTDGDVFERVRVTSEVMVTERPALGVRQQELPPGGGPGSLGPPSQLRAQGQAEMEERLASGVWSEVPAPRGWVRIELRRAINAGELISPASSAFTVPYYGDLDAVESVLVLTTNVERLEGIEERFVILADGSRVLVESRHTTVEALPASSWDAFVAEVWGDD